MKNAKLLNRRNLIQSIGAAPLLFGASNSNAGERPASYSEIGKPAPVFDLAKVGGGRFNNASLRGKTTIIEFWGLWCPDCLLDADNVAALAQRVRRERGINFVSVHTRGRYGRWGNIPAYFSEKGFSYPVAIDDDSAAYRAFKIAWVPSFVIVNPRGIIVDYSNDLGAGGGIGVDGLINKAKAASRIRR